MNGKEFEKWCEENQGGSNVAYSANGLDWRIVQMKDGWFAVFRYDYETGTYNPRTQAKTLSHALDYIGLHEAVPVPLQKLC